MATITRLDVGCGNHRMDQAIGIDLFPLKGVDIVHDVNQAPWPLEADRFEFIRCQHAIEHFREVHNVAREMYRVAKDGATVKFITPHYSSYASWGDPTHVHHFALGSLPQLFSQAIGDDKFTVLENRLKFTGSLFDLPGQIIYWLSPRKYEKYFAWNFPTNEIHTTIQFRK